MGISVTVKNGTRVKTGDGSEHARDGAIVGSGKSRTRPEYILGWSGTCLELERSWLKHV